MRTTPAFWLTHSAPSGAAARPTTIGPPSMAGLIIVTRRSGFVSSTAKPSVVPAHSLWSCQRIERTESLGAPVDWRQTLTNARCVTSTPLRRSRRCAGSKGSTLR